MNRHLCPKMALSNTWIATRRPLRSVRCTIGQWRMRGSRMEVIGGMWWWKMRSLVMLRSMGAYLVVATGKNSQGFIPDFTRLEEFKGVLIHSSEYESGKCFTGKDVLVVGCGNSSMEIATICQAGMLILPLLSAARYVTFVPFLFIFICVF